MRAQDRREHFLDRRLAVAADDDDHGDRELAAPVRRERAKRGLRVGDDDEVAGEVVGAIGGDQRGNGAALESCGDEVVAVEALAGKRDEEVAVLQRAGVGGDAREAHRIADDAAGDRARGGGGVHHASPRRFKAASAVSTSEKCVRTPAIS